MRRKYVMLAMSVMLMYTHNQSYALGIDNVSADTTGEVYQSAALDFNQASTLYGRGSYADALVLVDKGLVSDKLYFPLWKLKAQILSKMNRPEEMDAAAAIYLLSQPKDVEFKAFWLDSLLSRPINFDEKKELVDNFFKVYAHTAADAVDALADYLDNYDFKPSLNVLLESWKDANIGLNDLRDAMVAYQEKDYMKAVSLVPSMYNPAYRVENKLAASVSFIVAMGLLESGEEKLAYDILVSLENSPYRTLKVTWEIGHIHRLAGRPAEAAKAWGKGWRQADNPDIWLIRIVDAYIAAGDDQAAYDTLKQALAAFPKNPLLQARNMLVLHFLNKEYELDQYMRNLNGLNYTLGLEYGKALIAWNDNQANKANKILEDAAVLNKDHWNLALLDRNTPEVELKVAPELALSSENVRRAIQLRDRGWRYWEARDYDMALQVWNEALDIGLPNSREFIVQITTLMLEAGIPGRGLQVFRERIPQVGIMGLAAYYVNSNRWYVMPALLGAYTPTPEEAPWANLLLAYSALRMGRESTLRASFPALKAQGLPAQNLPVTTMDFKFDFVSTSLTPSKYSEILSNFVDVALSQKKLDLVLDLSGSRAWSALPASKRQVALSKSYRTSLELKDVNLFLGMTQAYNFNDLNPTTRKELLTIASRLIVDGYYTELFDILYSPTWQQIPANERVTLYNQIAMMYYSNNEFEISREWVDRSLELNSASPDANLLMALLEMKEATPDMEKIQHYASLGQGKASQTISHFVQAQMAALNSDFDTAIEHYKAYLALEPDDYQTTYVTVDYLIKAGRAQEAVPYKQTLEKAYASGNKSIRVYLVFTRQLFGELESAKKLWEEILIDYPANTNYLANYGDVLMALGKHQLLLEKLAPYSADSVRITALLAEASLLKNDIENAERYVALGLEMAPDNLSLLRSALAVYEILQDFEKLVVYSKQMLTYNNANINARRLLVQSQMELEDWEALAESVEIYGELNPMNEQIIRARSELAKTKTKYNSPRRVQKTDRYLYETFSSDPTNALRYAVSSAGTSDYSTAFKTLDALIEEGSNAGIVSYYYPNVGETSQINLSQLLRQIRYFSMNGYAFSPLSGYWVERGKTRRAALLKRNSTTDRLDPIPIFLMIGHISKSDLIEVDQLLATIGGRASLVVETKNFSTGGMTNEVDLDLLKKLSNSGRWDFILTDTSEANIEDNGGVHSFWTYRQNYMISYPDGSVDYRKESKQEMTERLSQRMSAIRKLADDNRINITAWLYPNGDWGQLTVESDEDTILAIRDATKRHFQFAFSPTSTGYWVKQVNNTELRKNDRMRLPTKFIYQNLTFEEMDEIRLQHPTRQAVLEMAKVTSWNGQVPRAQKLFERAEDIGYEGNDILIFQGRNLLYGSDAPHALELGELALDLNPDDIRAQSLVVDARKQKRPNLTPTYRHFDDSDGNTFKEIGGQFSWFAGEKLEMGIGYTWLEYSDRIGEVEGFRFSIDAKYYTRPLHWVYASIVFNDYDIARASNFVGGRIGYHGAFGSIKSTFNGTYDFYYSYGSVETRQAVLAGVKASQFGASTTFRWANKWDTDLGLTYTTRNDDNDTIAFNFRTTYRLSEAPLIRFGYWYQFGDSDRDPPEYYAPVDYQSHTAVLIARHNFSPNLSIGGLLAYGVSKSKDNDWDTILRANADLTWKINDTFWLSLFYNHYDAADYNSDEFRMSLKVFF